MLGDAILGVDNYLQHNPVCFDVTWTHIHPDFQIPVIFKFISATQGELTGVAKFCQILLDLLGVFLSSFFLHHKDCSIKLLMFVANSV